MFQALRKKRATHRAYKRTVDYCLTVLFCRFPDGLLPSVRQRVGDSGLVWRGQVEGIDARICSVQVAVLHTRKIIGRLSKQERHKLAQAFLQNDASNPTYRGFKHMFQVVEQFNVSPALVSYLKTEVASWPVSGSNFQLMGRDTDRGRNKPAARTVLRRSRAQEGPLAVTSNWLAESEGPSLVSTVA
jgi:hypothetical protein